MPDDIHSTSEEAYHQHRMNRIAIAHVTVAHLPEGGAVYTVFNGTRTDFLGMVAVLRNGDIEHVHMDDASNIHTDHANLTTDAAIRHIMTGD